MSTELLKEVQELTKRTNGTLKLQRCELNVQAYSHTGLQLKHVAPIHLTVGPMDFVHPSIRVNTQHVPAPHWKRFA